MTRPSWVEFRHWSGHTLGCSETWLHGLGGRDYLWGHPLVFKTGLFRSLLESWWVGVKGGSRTTVGTQLMKMVCKWKVDSLSPLTNLTIGLNVVTVIAGCCSAALSLFPLTYSPDLHN